EYACRGMSEAQPEAVDREESGPVKKTPAPSPAPSSTRMLPRGRERRVVRYRARSENTWRFVRAYTTTFQVIFSYLWLFWKAKVLGRSYREHHIAQVHKRNARRVYETILKLQGLFIKVGQALSIMANFLPEAFRAELEGLQDQVPPRP